MRQKLPTNCVKIENKNQWVCLSVLRCCFSVYTRSLSRQIYFIQCIYRIYLRFFFASLVCSVRVVMIGWCLCSFHTDIVLQLFCWTTYRVDCRVCACDVCASLCLYECIRVFCCMCTVHIVGWCLYGAPVCVHTYNIVLVSALCVQLRIGINVYPYIRINHRWLFVIAYNKNIVAGAQTFGRSATGGATVDDVKQVGDLNHSNWNGCFFFLPDILPSEIQMNFHWLCQAINLDGFFYCFEYFWSIVISLNDAKSLLCQRNKM